MNCKARYNNYYQDIMPNISQFGQAIILQLDKSKWQSIYEMLGQVSCLLEKWPAVIFSSIVDMSTWTCNVVIVILYMYYNVHKSYTVYMTTLIPKKSTKTRLHTCAVSCRSQSSTCTYCMYNVYVHVHV